MKRLGVWFLIAALWFSTSALGADKLKVASSIRGLWDSTMVEFGKEKGIFADEGLDIELVFLQTGVDVLQTVIAGGADLGIGTGTGGAIAAVSKGAPVVIVGSEFNGASDFFFYARGDSGISSFKDLDGRKLGIAHPGSTSQIVSSLLASTLKVKVNLVVTGGPTATITQVMTGQVDAGWSGFPFGIDRVNSGELRIIASGNDAPGLALQTTRVTVANRESLRRSEALIKRFFKAYAKVLDWAYSGDEALSKYAAINRISVETARDIVKRAYPREALETNRIRSTDLMVSEAVRNKVLDKAPSKQELDAIFKSVAEIHQ